METGKEKEERAVGAAAEAVAAAVEAAAAGAAVVAAAFGIRLADQRELKTRMCVACESVTDDNVCDTAA